MEANPAAWSTYGYTREEFVGLTGRDIVHPDYHHLFLRLTENYLVPLGITSILDAGIMLEGKLVGVLCLEHIGEKRRWHSDEEVFASTVASMVAQLYANIQRKLAEERTRYISFHDGLTDLYNRYYLEEEMNRLDTPRQLPISLIMVDANNLKLVNDTFGHYAGPAGVEMNLSFSCPEPQEKKPGLYAIE